MLPAASATAVVASFFFVPTAGLAAGGGAAVSLALSSGQATPRSGNGSRGALGSSSAGSCGGKVGAGGAAVWACAGNANTAAAAAHSSRAAPTLEPRPLIQGPALTSGPEPRQYVPSVIEALSGPCRSLRRC